MVFHELPCIGSGNIGSWGLVTLSRDSIIVIDGGHSGNHEVSVYEFQTQSWRTLCQLPPTMVQYAASLHRFSSVVVRNFLYVLLLPSQEGVSTYKIAALDLHRIKWAEFDVTTPREYSRIRLMGVQEQLVLVGVQEGILSKVEEFYIMNVVLSTTGSTCVEVSEMPGGFCGAIVEETNSVLKFKTVVCGHKDSIFFISSRGKPVVYSSTKNAWSYVPPFSKMQHVPNHIDLDNASVAVQNPLRVRSPSTQIINGPPSVVDGRPPRWRKCGNH
jgi:hypothetical protein